MRKSSPTGAYIKMSVHGNTDADVERGTALVSLLTGVSTLPSPGALNSAIGRDHRAMYGVGGPPTNARALPSTPRDEPSRLAVRRRPRAGVARAATQAFIRSTAHRRVLPGEGGSGNRPRCRRRPQMARGLPAPIERPRASYFLSRRSVWRAPGLPSGPQRPLQGWANKGPPTGRQEGR